MSDSDIEALTEFFAILIEIEADNEE